MKQWQEKRTWFVITGVVVVLLLGWWMLSGGKGEVQPALVKLEKAATVHAAAELVIHLPTKLGNQDRPFTQVTVRTEGEVQRAASTPELSGNFFLEARGRGNVFFADGDTRILRDQVLFNLNNLPVFFNPKGNLVHRWTQVPVALMETKNSAQIQEKVAAIFANLKKAGKETINGESTQRFQESLTEDQEKQLADVVRQQASGNRTWNVLARLLDGLRVKTVTVFIGHSDELRRVQVEFIPNTKGFDTPAATLTLTFTDYGKKVKFDIPKSELTAQPGVFAKIFGTGQVSQNSLSQ